MANKYTYSRSLDEYLNDNKADELNLETQESEVLDEQTGLVQRNASKAQAQASQYDTTQKYEPFNFMDRWGEALVASHPTASDARYLGSGNSDDMEARTLAISTFLDQNMIRNEQLDSTLRGPRVSQGDIGPAVDMNTPSLGTPSIEDAPLMGRPSTAEQPVMTPDMEGVDTRAVTVQGGDGMFEPDADTTPTITTQATEPSAVPSGESRTIVQRFVDDMEVFEGLGGDKLMGSRMPTYAYGITERKANEYGMSPSDYGSMRDFAEAFSERYMAEKEARYPDVFDDLSEEDKLALHSYLYNAGRFYPAQLSRLREGDLRGFIHEARDVIKSEGYSVTGLSKRRAAEANMLGRNIDGWVPIAEVRARGTRSRPIFDWLDAEGNLIESYTSNKPLHSGSSLGTVPVPQFN